MKYNFLESHSFYTYIQYAWALYRIYMSDELILYGWDQGYHNFGILFLKSFTEDIRFLSQAAESCITHCHFIYISQLNMLEVFPHVFSFKIIYCVDNRFAIISKINFFHIKIISQPSFQLYFSKIKRCFGEFRNHVTYLHKTRDSFVTNVY